MSNDNVQTPTLVSIFIRWLLGQVLDKGRIVQAGKYEDLLQAGTNFQSLVNAHNKAIDGMDANDQSEGTGSPELLLSFQFPFRACIRVIL